ncbi:hypothetical protein SK571_05135 [Lentzea sp. BCCO 10_0798]|uniref:Uncharacterized protein n=1 Tax=Lentzea kristufekii TaxID=3095430 RepID=A0ABU4TKD5_9PSEU|nr:hypothetical protein [Lentzea sp. BCCO 10_0798]MDX8048753.1 hypothetical protein [Lentzea sp. BCCO 10_0798]
MDQEAWWADRAREFADLRSRHVRSWIGVEWALREDVPESGPHVFHDPSVPCLQLWGLQAVLDDGELFTVGTCAHFGDSSTCGLWRHQDLDERVRDSRTWAEPGRGTRWRVLSELPAGPVGDVTCFADEGVLAEVLLKIGGRPLLLMAGELYETWTDELDFHRLDESVLAFTDPAAADRISWTTSRQGLRAL